MRLLQTYPHFMELKDYQRRVLEELAEYAENVAQFQGIDAIPNPAEVAFVSRTNKPWQPLTHDPMAPFVCLKVPTGGGKTLLAAHVANRIYNALLQDKDDTGIILWLTPSDAIRSQTLRALKDPNHPYRRVLETSFSTTVNVLDNSEALRIRPDQMRDGLSVIVSTMQSMKREDKEGLKAYEDNGYLEAHFSTEEENSEVKFSLFEVIRRSRPLIVADEGHNAKTALALDLFESLEPSFVLELTATPHDRSNVLSEVSALELKEEQMVKLPINLVNEAHWEAALRGAVEKRNKLEKIAQEERKETGEYIRPMVLVQAEQAAANPDKVHVARVKTFLVEELGVAESQVKIKTGTQDELGSTDLLAEDVDIRYIITRDALREGWDAPFAYVLASVFNLGATTAVEQLLGRILRLPNVHEKEREELNEGYVYTSAELFSKAVDSIVNSMVKNGYSRHEVRIRETADPKYTTVMQARHAAGLSIPLMAVSADGGTRELRYVRDLLGTEFNADDLTFDPDGLHDPRAQAAKVDVGEERPFVTEMSEAQDHGDEEGLAENASDLIRWLLKKIGRYEELADRDLRRYVEKALRELQEAYSLDALHRMKYQIRDRLQQSLDAHYLIWAEGRYEILKEGGELVASSEVFYPIPETLKLPTSRCITSFRKSVFEYAGKLNAEELEFATKLDGLENLMCWYRNLDRGGFALQGYWRAKFNPDFIAFTKSGKSVVLEYKGEDRVTSEDAIYKERLGSDWAALDPDHRYFKMVTKANMPDTLEEITRL
jgi:superfamily II DNA or RNA helicase